MILPPPRHKKSTQCRETPGLSHCEGSGFFYRHAVEQLREPFKLRDGRALVLYQRHQTFAGRLREVLPNGCWHGENLVALKRRYQLRQALPNATFVAFTGTHISTEDKDTRGVFGALETNEASVRLLGDSELKAIARELTNYLRNNLKTDWSVRESVRPSVRAAMRVRVRLILRRHKYPPDMEQRAVELVLKQAEALSEEWVA